MATNKSKLTEIQLQLFNKVVYDKKNIFFTGSAGTGKSFVLKCIVDHLREHFGQHSTAVTASTGIAAFNISGTTLHSFAGIGLGGGTAEQLYKSAFFNPNSAERWRKVKTLVIDEISMISGELFDKLNYVAKKIKNNSEPFGGIQIVLVGDLLQLPPVNTSNKYKIRIFESESWKECIKEYFLLKQVLRQEDKEFIKVLQYIRVGIADTDVETLLDKLQKPKEFDEDGGVVNLFAKRTTTSAFNSDKLNSIDSELIEYEAEDNYTALSINKNKIFDNCQALDLLKLKIGCQVMIVKNITKDLVNGTVGTVIAFTKQITNQQYLDNISIPNERLPIVRFKLANKKTFTRPVKRESWDVIDSVGNRLATRTQIPLILAWAITIHKSQSQTIQRLRVDVTDVFETGQLYTAISRAVNIDNIEVKGFNKNKVHVDQIALKFCMDNKLI